MISKDNALILEWIQTHDRCFFSDDDSIPVWITEVRLDHLVSLGFLHYTCDSSGLGFYQLLPAGEDALFEFAEEECRRAEQKENENRQNQLQDKRWRKDARRSWVQWAVTTILAISTFFAGAITEKLTGFMEWIVSLLH